LDSAQNIVLDASQSTFHTDAKNRSAGAEVGVGYSIGAQTGVYAYAAVNAGKGHSNSDGTINNNTQLKADTITINSNGDTTLKGAVATAKTINVDVGGKLAIESVQDTTRNDSSQTNVGARVQVSFGTAWQASGNLSQQKSNGSSTAVGEQSGLFAGDGGYHVKADTVDLKGGAIASTNATTSELTTNKLTTSNLENKMDYSASNVSLAGGIGGKSELARNDNGTVKSLDQQKQLFGTAKDGNVTPGLPMMEKGSDSSTTYATVTDGKITIGGVTTGSVKDLGINADASKAHTALDKLPDLQEVLKNQQAMSAAAGTVLATSKQIIGTIANSASVAASRDQIEAQKVLNDPNSTAEQIAAANLAKADAEKTQAGWAPGGVYSRALNAGVEILVGGMSGQAGGQIAANAMGPTVAKTVGDIGSALQAEAYLDAREFEKQSKQAALNNDPKAAAELAAKAAEADATAANWGDNGLYRVGLHATTQALLGDLANGQSGALAGAAGVVGGNLGQQLAQSLATAEADKLGLIGEKRTAFINAYQQTGAVIGGMVAGAAAANGDAMLAAAQAGQSAGNVDEFNRRLHNGDKEVANTLAKRSSGKFSEKEILDALRYAGLKDGKGNILVAEGSQETFVGLKDIKTGQSITADSGMPLMSIPGDQITLMEKAPTKPSNELMAYIIANTGGESSRYVLTPGPNYVSANSLPKAPEGTRRVSVSIDGATYFPLVADCPAASCTNGTPIANAIPDEGTKAYYDALARKNEKDLNIATSLFGLPGSTLRLLNGLTDLVTTTTALGTVNGAASGGKAAVNGAFAFPTWSASNNGLYSAKPGSVIFAETGLPRITADDIVLGLPKTGESTKAVNGANTIPTHLTMADLASTPIGSGAEKTVYSILGGKDRVIALQNESNMQFLHAEISALKQLDAMGIPVVKNYGIAHVDGRPGLVMENVPGVSSKTIYDFGLVEGANSTMLNAKSISDLQLIRSRLEINNINVTDIQFLIGNDGRVVLNDPMGVGHGVSADDLRHIDALIELAKKNGKK
jgi:hypothetical protein